MSSDDDNEWSGCIFPEHKHRGYIHFRDVIHMPTCSGLLSLPLVFRHCDESGYIIRHLTFGTRQVFAEIPREPFDALLSFLRNNKTVTYLNILFPVSYYGFTDFSKDYRAALLDALAHNTVLRSVRFSRVLKPLNLKDSRLLFQTNSTLESLYVDPRRPDMVMLLGLERNKWNRQQKENTLLEIILKRMKLLRKKIN